MHIKSEVITQFVSFHVFVEDSVNEMPMFEQLKKQVPVNSKQFLTPH